MVKNLLVPLLSLIVDVKSIKQKNYNITTQKYSKYVVYKYKKIININRTYLNKNQS